ncbi:hypothetical protein SAMN04488038_106123 [Solimonas aquatica]|uniref:DUF1820 family protein n=1 Tax=Solimonas aquatica TaxID=489703 RepID=A0A1H9FW12_9GAMM|nr:DUF1820 family protein [Solimonas aquatica]SEQ42135.1 hypothetical protein SAMN04488038_106123 [Solimonas aquatica]
MAAPKRLYRVSFMNKGQVYEIYAREVSHGAMLGFVEIGKLVFGEQSTLVVDTSEEKLKQEFAGVERFYVPVHAVVRIDEVNKQGPSRIVEGEGGSGSSKVTPLPFYTFGGDGKK